MKKTIFSLLLLATLCACSQDTPFTPIEKNNPWEDNYQSIAGMENYKQWGTYNVHDPACKQFGEYYYMYSTDAIYRENKEEAKEKGVPMGYIQVRRSQDMVNWEFVGWAFPEIPQEAVDWVKGLNEGRGAGNIWAPYIVQYKDTYRLYYCVSAFGRRTSYIGLAESDSPEGPWTQKGCVVKTDRESVMNAIDPSLIEDPETGRWWMHYGSYFGGLFCVEINPETGLTLTPGDQGHLTARRANYRKDNLEAPEILYNPELKQYYLFVSYDPLMTSYNVRVGRSDKPEGPFFDFNGLNLADTTNNYPILTAPYRFENHPGWAGTAHCGVLHDNKGDYYLFHQARLSPDNEMMVLHNRRLYFTEEGWPVVSSQRYAATPQRDFTAIDMAGSWEVIQIDEPALERKLEAGQVLWGEGRLVDNEGNESVRLVLQEDGLVANHGQWSFNDEKQTLSLTLGDDEINNLIIEAGQDWENQKVTILFTGLDKQGRSIWGKKVSGEMVSSE